MADPVTFEQLSRLPWFRRAIDPSSPTTQANESVRTASQQVGDKEILFPTIRMINGQLVKFSIDEAREIAIENNDFLTFDSPESATEASKFISDLLGRVRENPESLTMKEFVIMRDIQQGIR